jgi:hypothetical protein
LLTRIRFSELDIQPHRQHHSAAFASAAASALIAIASNSDVRLE